VQSLGESDIDGFKTTMQMILDMDVRLFYKILEKNGYDIWLEKVGMVGNQPEKEGITETLSNLEYMKLKTFVEGELCQENKSVLTFKPYSLRETSKLQQWNQVKPDATAQSHVNYYSSELFHSNYKEIAQKLSQIELRYHWALLMTFNQCFAQSVPFINNSITIPNIPANSIPLTLSAFLSSSNNLCLSNVKFDLRHLILEKTAVARENTPKLVFDRLRMAEGKIDADAKEKATDFIYGQAFEQAKSLDFAHLRPTKPHGAEPHLSFMVVFRGEHVVGEGGPYRQFFADISKELQTVRTLSAQKVLNLLTRTPNNKGEATLGKDRWTISPRCSSSNDLSRFRFLGVLMGICIRTGSNLTLDLP